MLTAQDLIVALDLRPLAREGGYYRETYRSGQLAPNRDRSLCTAIYYLLTPVTCSALHRLSGDEIFHFYLGDPVSMLQLRPDGTGQVVTLGSDVLAGQTPQVIVAAGVWQGSWLASGGAYALLGTTMAPGFDFADYEAGDRAGLTRAYPEFAELIARLTVEVE
jgi:predicted cupin superfamily sugar epimerase